MGLFNSKANYEKNRTKKWRPAGGSRAKDIAVFSLLRRTETQSLSYGTFSVEMVFAGEQVSSMSIVQYKIHATTYPESLRNASTGIAVMREPTLRLGKVAAARLVRIADVVEKNRARKLDMDDVEIAMAMAMYLAVSGKTVLDAAVPTSKIWGYFNRFKVQLESIREIE